MASMAAGCGMRSLARFALDVCIRFETAGLADVALKTWAVLAEVVPAAGLMRPLGTVAICEMGGERADGFQMFVQIMRRAPIAHAVFRGMGNRV